MTEGKVGFLVFVTFVVVLVGQVPQVTGLSCFSCYSVNGSDRRCDDPMIRMYTGIIDPVECTLPTVNDEDENITVMSEEQGPKYETELKATETEAPLKPWSMRSTYCVKMIGISEETKEPLVIRSCIDRNLDSQCGVLTFKGQKVRGCMLTCKKNMCNSSDKLTTNLKFLALFSLLFFIAK